MQPDWRYAIDVILSEMAKPSGQHSTILHSPVSLFQCEYTRQTTSHTTQHIVFLRQHSLHTRNSVQHIASKCLFRICLCPVAVSCVIPSFLLFLGGIHLVIYLLLFSHVIRPKGMHTHWRILDRRTAFGLSTPKYVTHKRFVIFHYHYYFCNRTRALALMWVRDINSALQMFSWCQPKHKSVANNNNSHRNGPFE